MRQRNWLPVFVLAAAFALLVLPTHVAIAHPSYFTNLCAGCHSNDTPTCNGCHHHVGTLTATPDHSSYPPGATVTVTLNGGTQHGWIRAVLYDQSHQEIARATGPTGMGDDGQANAVVFPVSLHGAAPMQTGDYVWQMAWFGNDNGNGHIELPVNVPIHVARDPAGVDNGPPLLLLRTWGLIRSNFR